jgi:hypothetical protein
VVVGNQEEMVQVEKVFQVEKMEGDQMEILHLIQQ